MATYFEPHRVFPPFSPFYPLFIDLASAFKRIVQEKVAIETILKASTPLEDLGDVEALEAHLQNMSSKTEVRNLVINVAYLGQGLFG